MLILYVSLDLQQNRATAEDISQVTYNVMNKSIHQGNATSIRMNSVHSYI